MTNLIIFILLYTKPVARKYFKRVDKINGVVYDDWYEQQLAELSHVNTQKNFELENQIEQEELDQWGYKETRSTQKIIRRKKRTKNTGE